MKLNDLRKPLLLLLDDAHAAEELLELSDGQFQRRAYVRSTIAVIEGTIWLLKRTCLGASDPNKSRRLSIAEFAMLSDQTYELKRNGEVRTSTKFLKLADNLRFTIKTCNRLFGCNLDLQVGDAAWDRFLNTVEVRNRITHPKVVADFDIADREIEDCKQVVEWFNVIIHGFFLQILDNAKSTATRDTSESP